MSSPYRTSITVGPLLLGNLVSAVFYGVACVQGYAYYTASYKDSTYFRLLIFFLWFLDTFHLALISYSSYHYLISNFGNIMTIMTDTWSLFLQIYLTSIITGTIRMIFGRRVWLISRKNIFVAACVFGTSGASFLCAIVFASKGFAVHSFNSLLNISYFLYAGLGSGVAADVLIAASLYIGLSQSRTGYEKTESVINATTLCTIYHCVLATSCSILSLVTYAVWPQTFICISIFYSLSKLYLCNLLVTLNSREKLVAKFSRDHPTKLTSEWKFVIQSTDEAEREEVNIE